jgi:hypothetical protein
MATSRNLGHVFNGVRPSSGAATSGSSRAAREQTVVAAPEDGRTPPLNGRNLWPLGIILTLVTFFAGTVGLVVLACSQRADLVSPDYYEKEIKFQGQIDRAERTHRAASQASVAYEAAGKCITVSLPAEQAGREISGRIELYRPSAAGLDRALKLAPDGKGVQRLDAAGLAPGLWKVRVSWTFERQDYFLDQKVVVGAKTS